MTTIVDVVNVDKTYRMGTVDVPALRDVNITINDGDFVSIMGPSGSGKSTLMNLIGCLDRPTSGDIIIRGRNVNKLSDNELAHLRGKEVGFVFQTFNLIPRMDALRNVELPMIYQELSRDERKAKAKKLLIGVGLGDRMHHKPMELSGGERQRVAIARALANDPTILLSDEPTGNLDTKTGAEILSLFKKLNDDGRTIITVTHDPEIAGYSERIIRLKDGRIVGGKDEN